MSDDNDDGDKVTRGGFWWNLLGDFFEMVTSLTWIAFLLSLFE